jgi:hypothetical protein
MVPRNSELSAGEPFFSGPAWCAQLQAPPVLPGNVRARPLGVDDPRSTPLPSAPTLTFVPVLTRDGGPAPGLREQAALAFEDDSATFLLFGGNGAAGPLDDLWRTDRMTWWPEPVTGVRPPPRFGHSLTWDQARHRLVLFGGFQADGGVLSDTWVFADGGWAPVTGPGPSPRGLAGLISLDQGVTLVGGAASRTVDAGLRDLWLLGDQWQPLDASVPVDPLLSPVCSARGHLTLGSVDFDGVRWRSPRVDDLAPTRVWPAMAFDPRRLTVVLEGGSDWYLSCSEVDCSTVENTPLDDTWEWDGDQWSPVDAGTSSAGWYGARPVWDEAQGRLLLVGGQSPFQPDASLPVWVMDGGAWVPLSTSPALPQRFAPAVSSSASRGGVVMQGGQAAHGETWLLDGSTWSALPVGPDLYRHSVVESDRFGGPLLRRPGSLGWQTWLLDTSWAPLAIPGEATIGGAQLASAPARQEVVAFGQYPWWAGARIGAGWWESVASSENDLPGVVFDEARDEYVLHGAQGTQLFSGSVGQPAISVRLAPPATTPTPTRTTQVRVSLDVGGSGWEANQLVSGATVVMLRRASMPVVASTDAGVLAPAHVHFELSGLALERAQRTYSDLSTAANQLMPATQFLVFPRGTNGRTSAEVAVRRVEIRYRYRRLAP